MIELYFDKLYRYDRKAEHSYVAIPLKKGALTSTDNVAVLQDGQAVPSQCKVTSYHDDGSIRYLFVRFMADLPGNKKAVLHCDVNSSKKSDYCGIHIEKKERGYFVSADGLEFEVADDSGNIFRYLKAGEKVYGEKQFSGPYLTDGNNEKYDVRIEKWSIVEQGPICAVLKAKGSNLSKEKKIDFEVKLTVYAGKPWVEVSYRIINTSEEELHVASLVFSVLKDEDTVMNYTLQEVKVDKETDSTGCGDDILDNSANNGPVFHTRGITELDLIQEKAPADRVRTCVGHSNYKTDFYVGRDGEQVNTSVDDKFLVKEANEHFGEVFYGTFFADRTDSTGGVCATVFQAQQNYPKAVKADADGVAVMLVPEGINKVVLQSGMSREQRVLLHFHDAEESLLEIDNRSLIYQMPDRPYINPKVFKEADVMLDVFPDKLNDDVEIALIAKADAHSRGYGMLNWGDSPDMGYTLQGRGNGELVWCNNEYDYPHSCALLYARTGVRRFMDYLLVSASHWMDVDVCHYSSNPLRIGGQWEHTRRHCVDGIMVCSHEWVEGLIDYYHFSGDERGIETAIGIGENVLRLLDTPMYAHPGEANARETGWALRSLTALYVETHDRKWLAKSRWIIDSFKMWEQQYGNWLAPYTDNTAIRVGFMISIAVGSVMRYYRVFPEPEIKDMMLRAVDDLIENCLLPNGLFYYKELPSTARLGNNTLLLEALAIAYELTGNAEYLKPGMKTFIKAVTTIPAGGAGRKTVEGDTVLVAGDSTKTFAQSFIPLITYYKAVSEEGMY